MVTCRIVLEVTYAENLAKRMLLFSMVLGGISFVAFPLALMLSSTMGKIQFFSYNVS
jgi:hypothetical protein